MRTFYVLYIKDRGLSDILEAIRFLSDPTEKHRAHITVRGPYQKRIQLDRINCRLAGDMVSIDGVDNFFQSGQNTVYFHCTSSKLREVWNKPDYPFNPHITLYDSGSSDFARSLYGIISKYRYLLHFRADELEAIETKKGQSTFSLALAFNSDLVKEIVGQRISPSEVQSLSEERRLKYVDSLCLHLSGLSAAVRSRH